MKKFTKKEINKAVGILCRELKKKNISQNIYLILIGAASIIVRHNLDRATRDIDIMDTGIPKQIGGLGTLLSELGYHVVSDAIVNLHPDYVDRLERVTEKGNVIVFSLGPYDLAISKISRGLKRDFHDILTSDLRDELEMGVLQKLYFDASSYWIGRPETFKSNWELFVDEYEKA
jgi:hypothetical protein